MRTLRLRPLALSSLLVAMLAVVAVPTAIASAGAAPARNTRAHVPVARVSRGPSYMTGLGNEQPNMFKSALWKQLKTKIVRYVAPYDAVAHPYSLALATQFIRAAEAAHQEVLIAFYHSEYTPTKLPNLKSYQRDVAKFIKLFPHVRQYEAWDESNRGNEPPLFTSPSAARTAQYYQQLIRACHGCTVIGLDVLDQASIGGTLQYISEFKREIGRLETIMPRIWGLHNYSDINRLESWRTRDLVRALGGQVWLTETGGIVKFGGSFPNKRGSGLTRAAKVLKYMFGLAGGLPRVKRLYIYDWTGGTASTRFDAGLTNAREQPREGYVVVCKQLRAARCNVKVADN
ncbi:MAG TPA: hypothetical protein VGY13_02075 [Solirubrobacteraceae bacterium]|jgi:hypothetical protein|nr:hypothetical protein [Solirubrobacteraceae bacterium]